MQSEARQNEMNRISIADDFTRFPGGRFRKYGKFSGEQFRDDHLVGVLKNGDQVTVVLDRTEGYGSSFLEEAFGGLVRSGFTLEFLSDHLHLIAETPAFQPYVREAWQYIQDAASREPVEK